LQRAYHEERPFVNGYSFGHGSRWLLAGGLVLLARPVPAGPALPPDQSLPARVRLVVLHVLGSPSYDRPDRRWRFFPPPETQSLWKPRFGAHWIVWTDGSLWSRHPAEGEHTATRPPVDQPIDGAWRRRLAREAAPVYQHLFDGNSRSLGIEVAHSGRAEDPFPEAQIRSLAWLLQSLLGMSEGRLGPSAIAGHKDRDARPAYVRERCSRPGCPVYVDESGRPYRRRVDPPESLFAALAREGLRIPRPPGADDAELRRAEAVPTKTRPSVRH
jgi:N-acetylmuramoyl-L-alanine amidase-like protein